MDFSIDSNFNAEENCWNVFVNGEIDIFNSDSFKTDLLKLISDKQANVRMDCRNLSYIDSTGLGSMVGVLKNIKQYGGEFIILNLKSSLNKLFKITNLDKAFKIEVD
jgi:anti-sigma B factor antagonist